MALNLVLPVLSFGALLVFFAPILRPGTVLNRRVNLVMACSARITGPCFTLGAKPGLSLDYNDPTRF